MEITSTNYRIPIPCITLTLNCNIRTASGILTAYSYSITSTFCGYYSYGARDIAIDTWKLQARTACERYTKELNN